MTMSPTNTAHMAPSEAPAGGGSFGETGNVRGRVVTAPANNADAMVVASLDTGETWDVPAGQWDRKASSLPSEHALCLIVVDNRGDAWVPTWVGTTA